MRLGVNHALERSYYFLFASSRAKLFPSFPPLPVQMGASSPLRKQGGCGGHRPACGVPSVSSAGSPGQSGHLQARSRLQHSQAHLRSGIEQRPGPQHSSHAGWDAGVPSCSVQGYGVAMAPWLDPDPLLVRTAQGRGPWPPSHTHSSGMGTLSPFLYAQPGDGDPDPLLLHTGWGRGSCRGWWPSSTGGGPVGPSSGAPALLQLVALGLLST